MIDVEKYLESFYMIKRKPTLKTMKYFMNEYKEIDSKLKFIHIAGTNGKGSCAEMMTNILTRNGYNVGKFISPHLEKYNERISVNHKDISDDELKEIIEELNPKIEKYNQTNDEKVSFFELITIIALIYFYKKNVDFVVLETGLGGLYDSTNVISSPLVSIITSIGLDHMNILGNTIQEIAYQKAGIIKDNSDTVFFSQESEINEVIAKECKNKKNKFHLITDEKIVSKGWDCEYQYFSYDDVTNISINLKGEIQKKNACICIETTKILQKKGYKIDEKLMIEALSNVVHRARFEKLTDTPTIIYDGAHNLPAIENLVRNTRKYYQNEEKIFIVSILKTKDYKEMIKVLINQENGQFIFTSGDESEKFVSSEELFKEAKIYSNSSNFKKMSFKDALKYIQETNKIVFVVGTFYLYSAVKREINLLNSNKNI